HVRRLAALRAVLPADDAAAVETAPRLGSRRRQLVPRLEDAPLALHPRAESLCRLGPKARRVVLEVMVECRGALDAVADAPPLAFARRGFRDLDAGAMKARAMKHLAHVAGEPGVVIRDDVRVELALDFVDEGSRHGRLVSDDGRF